MTEFDETNAFQIKPQKEHKFRSGVVKDVIHEVLNEKLTGKPYSDTEAPTISKAIAESIKQRVKELKFPRYKVVVQVVIGEQKGEGVKVGSRCLWDVHTDNFATDVFLSDSLFCVAACYGVYYY